MIPVSQQGGLALSPLVASSADAAEACSVSYPLFLCVSLWFSLFVCLVPRFFICVFLSYLGSLCFQYPQMLYFLLWSLWALFVSLFLVFLSRSLSLSLLSLIHI